MRRAIFFFVLVANVTVAQQPLFCVVDLDVGATERVQIADGKSATVKLVSTSETRDRVRSAIRDARVDGDPKSIDPKHAAIASIS
jgi:hypothetical protein